MFSRCCFLASKSRFLKILIFNKSPKPLYSFCSSANKPLNEQTPDPKSCLSTTKSQTQMLKYEKSTTHDEHNPHTEKETFHEKIKTLCRSHKVDEAKRIILRLSDKGIGYDEDLFVLLISGYAKSSRKPDLVKNCVGIFLKMEELGVPRTIKSYNCLLNIFINEKKYMLVEKYSNKMLSEGVVPNKQSYTLMIMGFCSSSRVEAAKPLIEDMKSQNLGLDLCDYNTMINGYIQVKKMEEAEKMLMEMKGLKVGPLLGTYNSMINGYVQVRKMEDADKIMLEMKEQNVEPNLITYDTMIKGYASVGKMEDAHKLFVEMKKRNIEPELVTYVTLIKGYVMINRVDYGLMMLEDMKRKKFVGSKLDVNSCLGQLKEDCDFEKMSESQTNVLQKVEDYVERLELLAMRDTVRELSEFAERIGKVKMDSVIV